METFVPLYISNHCDSSCIMCNLKHTNKKVLRVEATLDKIEQQLLIIRDFEKIRAVCFLTGERYNTEDRFHNLSLVIAAIHVAFKLNFEKVFFNIGSLSVEEIRLVDQSFNSIEKSKLVLSLFQETYDRQAYSRFFGNGENNPKSDYKKRLSTIDIWVENGFSAIDIGILLGFERPLDDDVHALINHAKTCISAGVEVYVSVPRIKGGNVSDIEYREIVKQIRVSIPNAKLIITTREKIEFINSVIDNIDVVSPGSSDICPYLKADYISNSAATSQFVIEGKRLRPSVVLNKIDCKQILYYYP